MNSVGLANDAATAGVPVVFVSGDAQPNQLERAWTVGDAVLTKPPDRLVAEIRRALNAPHDTSSAPPCDDEMARASDQPRRPKVQAHQRFDTTQPPLTPPSIHCPSCSARGRCCRALKSFAESKAEAAEKIAAHIDRFRKLHVDRTLLMAGAFVDTSDNR